MGRALIAGMPDDERDWLLGYIKRQDGKNWPKTKTGIERAIRDFETRGFALALGDWERDINMIGVPLVVPDGVFAFHCGAPGFHFTREKLEATSGRAWSTWYATCKSLTAPSKARSPRARPHPLSSVNPRFPACLSPPIHTGTRPLRP